MYGLPYVYLGSSDSVNFSRFLFQNYTVYMI